MAAKIIAKEIIIDTQRFFKNSIYSPLLADSLFSISANRIIGFFIFAGFGKREYDPTDSSRYKQALQNIPIR